MIRGRLAELLSQIAEIPSKLLSFKWLFG